MRITRRRGSTAVLGTTLAMALAVTLAACAGNGNTLNGSRLTGPGTITVGSANFPESQIVASMYAQVLRRAGFPVQEKPDIGSREVYLKALQDGEITLVPEYIGTLTEYVNTQLNGPDASTAHPLATSDPDRTVAKLRGLLEKVGGLQVVSFARKATDQNSFAVTRQTVRRYNVHRMSDLGRPDVRGRLVLGAGPECEKRPFCLPGLQSVYGARFKQSGGTYRKFAKPGGSETLDALKDGTIDIGLVFTSDGSVDDAGLVRLADDKHLQPSDNICALARAGALTSEARRLVGKVNDTLTTDDLKALNRKFTVDKEDADTIAQDYLQAKKLR